MTKPLDLLQVYFNFTKGKGNAKEEKLKTRRDGGKGRKEGGGENIFSSSFLSSLPPVSPRFQFFLLRISFSFGKIKIDLEQVYKTLDSISFAFFEIFFEKFDIF